MICSGGVSRQLGMCHSVPAGLSSRIGMYLHRAVLPVLMFELNVRLALQQAII